MLTGFPLFCLQSPSVNPVTFAGEGNETVAIFSSSVEAVCHFLFDLETQYHKCLKRAGCLSQPFIFMLEFQAGAL